MYLRIYVSTYKCIHVGKYVYMYVTYVRTKYMFMYMMLLIRSYVIAHTHACHIAFIFTLIARLQS